MSMFPLPPGCRPVCRPNRSKPRKFSARDITRIVSAARRAGEPESLIREAVNRSGMFVLDNEARVILDKIPKDVFLRFESAARDVERAVKILDAIFGDTSWTLPRWLLRIIRGLIPIPWLRRLFNAGVELHRAVELLKRSLEHVRLLADAVLALKQLSEE